MNVEEFMDIVIGGHEDTLDELEPLLGHEIDGITVGITEVPEPLGTDRKGRAPVVSIGVYEGD